MWSQAVTSPKPPSNATLSHAFYATVDLYKITATSVHMGGKNFARDDYYNVTDLWSVLTASPVRRF